MKLSDTTYAVMGVITTGCRSGYDIKQMIDQSLNHFWKVSYGQIYPILKQLEQKGLATVQETSQDGKPAKKEYYLTDKGIGELKNWLEQPIMDTPTERNDVLLKLFFGRHQKKETTLSLVKDYQKRLEQRYDVYLAIEKHIMDCNPNDPDAEYWLITLDYGKKVTTAAIDWCMATISKLAD